MIFGVQSPDHIPQNDDVSFQYEYRYAVEGLRDVKTSYENFHKAAVFSFVCIAKYIFRAPRVLNFGDTSHKKPPLFWNVHVDVLRDCYSV